MDPDTALTELRRRITDYRHRVDHNLGRVDETDIEPIIELITALDTWLSHGGFLPHHWREARP